MAISGAAIIPPESLHFLVVDDVSDNTAFLAVMLDIMGHTAQQADSGEQALKLFRARQPDFVLMDVMMPGMGGYEAVREMRRMVEEWFPIVFITGMSRSDDAVCGFEAGGDDYLIRPIDITILRAKIHSLHERLLLSRKLGMQNRLLLKYQNRNEAEQQAAAGYMQRLTMQHELQDPDVQHFLRSAENLSGDLIGVARTPEGVLHLLLADSTGHGLSAALAAMPVIDPFYAMTKKSFSIAAIASEMNCKVCQVLPVSHFVAVILVAVDPVAQKVEVWSGGCPPPVVLDSDGAIIHAFRPQHLALGILPPSEFDATLENYSFEGIKCSLLMFSDGVIEMEDMQGEQFGLDRLLRAAHVPDGVGDLGSWQNILAATTLFAEGRATAGDDMALMLVRCERMQIEQETALPTTQSRQCSATLWQFSLSLQVRQLRKMEVLPLLLDLVHRMEMSKERAGDLFLVLSELFNNALDHGLLKLDSSLKQNASGMDAYFDERERRLHGIHTGRVDMYLEKVMYEAGGAQLRIRVHDSGDGFDYRAVRKTLGEDTLRHGRGIGLVCHLCSTVEYMGNGSEVLACFDLPAGA